MSASKDVSCGVDTLPSFPKMWRHFPSNAQMSLCRPSHELPPEAKLREAIYTFSKVSIQCLECVSVIGHGLFQNEVAF